MNNWNVKRVGVLLMDLLVFKSVEDDKVRS